MELPDYPVKTLLPILSEELGIYTLGLLEAPPGSGKSTLVAPGLLDAPWLGGKKILLLQPRRLAAKSVAHRISSLLGEVPGKTVGYRVRFESLISKETRIEVITEGILVRQLQQDCTLSEVGLILLDEFHERSLDADVCLALLREVQQVLREDLRVLLMSATLNGEELSRKLGGVPIWKASGRQYPITITYAPSPKDMPLATATSRLVKKILSTHPQGDILVFLPGIGEISQVAKLLQETDAVVHLLYGDLALSEQTKVLEPHPEGKRKIILATAIAETSLTIEGITIVIDSGLSRVSRYDPRSGMNRLITVPVTLDSADQRAGRAGRTQAGYAYRMWEEKATGFMEVRRKPALVESDLSKVVLELLSFRPGAIASFNWLDPPPVGAVEQAIEILEKLQAIEEGKLTTIGKEMSKIPAHPRIARMLWEGQQQNLLPLAAAIAALLEEKDPLPSESGTHLGLRLALLAGQSVGFSPDRQRLQGIQRQYQQWKKIFSDKDNPTQIQGIEEKAGELLFYAYPDRVAQQLAPHSPRYRLRNGYIAKLPEGDPLQWEPWIVIAQVMGDPKDSRIVSALPFSPKLLEPHSVIKETLQWNENTGEISAIKETRVDALLIAQQTLPHPSAEVLIPWLKTLLQQKGNQLLDWNEQVLNLQARIINLQQWRPEFDLPNVSSESLFIHLDWIEPFLGEIKNTLALKKIPLLTAIQSLLTWEQQQVLDRLAPESIEVPTGSKITIQYSLTGGPPVLAVRLQEIFGWLETPNIAEGKIPLQMQLLSPAYRPVQVTMDLQSFWQKGYQEVRKDLRGRYPKHSWPEDPFTAQPVRGVVRKKKG